MLISLVMAMAVLIPPNSGQQTSKLPDADSRTELTLEGLFNYFWKTDPNNKNIEFLFACGQLGLMGSGSQGQCSCYTSTACVNCYRWWTAVMMESVATYGIHMNSTDNSSLPNVVYSHSPYNAKWDPTLVSTCTYIDDFLWYGIAYLRVYDWLSVSFNYDIVPYKNEIYPLNVCPTRLVGRICVCRMEPLLKGPQKDASHNCFAV